MSAAVPRATAAAVTAAEQAGPEELIALGCRILAFRGLAGDILGHISVRQDDGSLLVRCRGPRERGLLFTEPSDVHRVPLEGDPAPPDGHRVPNELPIHREVLRARPDIGAVVHVHPPHVVAADLAGLPLRPIVGAYDIPAMRMALDGIPVYPRAVLVTRSDLGQEVAAALADRPVAILRGHGIVATGDTVQQAVVRALSVESLALMTLRSAAGPRLPSTLPPEDVAELPDLGSGFNDTLVWNSHLAALEHAGLGL